MVRTVSPRRSWTLLVLVVVIVAAGLIVWRGTCHVEEAPAPEPSVPAREGDVAVPSGTEPGLSATDDARGEEARHEVVPPPVAGRVFDESSGDPLVRCRVELQVEFLENTIEETVTDENGRFTLPGGPEEGLVACVFPPLGWRVRTPTLSLEGRDPDALLEFPAYRVSTAPFHGLVIDEYSSEPVPHVEVLLEALGESSWARTRAEEKVRTDEHGEFTTKTCFDGGRISIWVIPASGSSVLEGWTPSTGSNEPTIISARVGPTYPLELSSDEFVAPTSLSAVLLQDLGFDAWAVPTWGHQPHAFVREGTIWPFARFSRGPIEAGFESGPCRLAVYSDRGFWLGSASIEAHFAGTSEPVPIVLCRCAVVHGRVAGSGDEKVDGFRLRIRHGNAADRVGEEESDYEIREEYFVVALREPGSYRLRAECGDVASDWIEVEVRLGAHVDRTCSLPQLLLLPSAAAAIPFGPRWPPMGRTTFRASSQAREIARTIGWLPMWHQWIPRGPDTSVTWSGGSCRATGRGPSPWRDSTRGATGSASRSTPLSQLPAPR